MRCPKCQYISFGAADRCRNCGYDFSLSAEAESLDLPIQSGREPVGPLRDLPLAAPSSQPEHAITRDAAADVEPDRPSRATGRPDLPLFTAPGADDAPLVTPPAVPRLPLSVRRDPIITRPRQQPSFEDEFAPGTGDEPPRKAAAGTDESSPAAGEAGMSAPAAGRALAGLLDLALMGSIDVAVVYLTLRLSNLELGDAMLLPKLPMLAFLLLLNGGYLVLFTAAGGQTIGKMATGIRVVPLAREAGLRVPFSTALVRAAGYLVSLLPAGLGFLPIVFSSDRRGVHDRLSNTRVVKA